MYCLNYGRVTLSRGQSSRTIEHLCDGTQQRKIWTVLDPATGDIAGKVDIIFRALYGLRMLLPPIEHILHSVHGT